MTGHEYFIGIKANGKIYPYYLDKLQAYQEIKGEHYLEVLDKFLANFEDENELKEFLAQNDQIITADEIFIYEKKKLSLLKVGKPLYKSKASLLDVENVKKMSDYLCAKEPAYYIYFLEYLKEFAEANSYKEKGEAYDMAFKKLAFFLRFNQNKGLKRSRTTSDYRKYKKEAKTGLPVIYKFILNKPHKETISYRFLHDFADFMAKTIDNIEFLRYCANLYIEYDCPKSDIKNFKEKNFLRRYVSYDQYLLLVNRDLLNNIGLDLAECEYEGKYINMADILKLRVLEEPVYDDSLRIFTDQYNKEHDTYYEPFELKEIYDQTYGPLPEINSENEHLSK